MYPRARVLLVMGVFAMAVNAEPTLAVQDQFSKFVTSFERNYELGSLEYNQRMAIFADNLERISTDQLNSPNSVHAVNQFADLSREEFLTQFTGSLSPLTPEDVQRVCLSGDVPPVFTAQDRARLPASFDWRDASPPVVTPVKDQGNCGSCWTFSSIGNIEGQYALAGNPLTSFSEQSFLDCSKGCVSFQGGSVCNAGCDGGWMFVGFDDMMKYGGVPTEEAYPYTAKDGTCEMADQKPVAIIANYTCITPPDGTGANEDDMATWLVANGPMAFAMDVSSIGSYSSGVYNPSTCSTTNLDHALLIVGFGSDDESGLDYWIVKNSWGASWGEEGYFRLVRGKAACGVNNAVTSVVLAK